MRIAINGLAITETMTGIGRATLASLRAMLERANHEVFFARDGEEALSEYQGKGIQVVLTDLQMPKLHGLELIDTGEINDELLETLRALGYLGHEESEEPASR